MLRWKKSNELIGHQRAGEGEEPFPSPAAAKDATQTWFFPALSELRNGLPAFAVWLCAGLLGRHPEVGDSAAEVQLALPQVLRFFKFT